MTANQMSLRYLMLGLIAEKPMSGYDIKQFLQRLSWLIGSPSFGSLYPALSRLARDGLLTVAVVLREDRPPRKVHSITEAGRSALQEWVAQPARFGSLKAFVMRLMVANSLSRDDLMAQLQQRLYDVTRYQARLADVTVALGQAGDSGQHLALEYSLAVARAETAWLGSALERMSQAAGDRRDAVPR